jgi:signal transduction histidine kinase
MRLAPRRFDAIELVREVARELSREAALRGVDIRVEGDPAEIVADRDLLKSAFLNVALNAVQMMPSGGLITIAAEAGDDGARIFFDDSGPGIAPEHLAKIFEPYFSTRDAGVGLGLAMTRKIVTDHGGELSAVNRPAGGTRFTFWLPRVAAAEAVGA